MPRSLTCLTITLFLLGSVSCQSPAPTETKSKSETDTAQKAEANMSSKEVVFDVRNPPPGFTKCHRNHCHREGGRAQTKLALQGSLLGEEVQEVEGGNQKRTQHYGGVQNGEVYYY